jgi:hypothetical protein
MNIYIHMMIDEHSYVWLANNDPDEQAVFDHMLGGRRWLGTPDQFRWLSAIAAMHNVTLKIKDYRCPPSSM